MGSNEDFTPKLAESNEVVSAFGSTPKRKASDRLVDAFVPTRSEPVSKSIIKVIKALLSLVFALGFTVLSAWLILISTVTATPTLNERIIVVDRSAWNMGGGEFGDIGYVSDSNSLDFIDKIVAHISGDINDGAIVRILGTPLDYVNTNVDGVLIINGNLTEISSDKIIDRKQLGDTYIVECLEGSCGIPGTLYELPIENMIGAVEGILKLFEIEEYAR